MNSKTKHTQQKQSFSLFYFNKYINWSVLFSLSHFFRPHRFVMLFVWQNFFFVFLKINQKIGSNWVLKLFHVWHWVLPVTLNALVFFFSLSMHVRDTWSTEKRHKPRFVLKKTHWSKNREKIMSLVWSFVLVSNNHFVDCVNCAFFFLSFFHLISPQSIVKDVIGDTFLRFINRTQSQWFSPCEIMIFRNAFN